MILIDENEILAIKEKINNPKDKWRYIRSELELLSADCDTDEIFSVTHNPCPAKTGGIHDYFSEGPYWWPDPKDPDAPYIRRDGEINPDRFDKHVKDFGKLARHITLLAYGGYYLDNTKLSDKAIKLIEAWFINSDTYMAPHLEYAQAIRGHCDGRGIGIIDFVNLISILNACDFLKLMNKYEKPLAAFSEWLNKFLEWLLTSKNGIDEKNNGNNHTTWYIALVLSIAAFTDNTSVMDEYFELYKSVVIVKQLNEDGAFPSELKRTKSFSYSIFNLNAAAIICEIAYRHNVDLWNFEMYNKSMRSAVNYHIPYMMNPYKWEHTQFNGVIPDSCFAFELAGLRLDMPLAWDANDVRGKDKMYLRYEQPIGYFPLLFGR